MGTKRRKEKLKRIIFRKDEIEFNLTR